MMILKCVVFINEAVARACGLPTELVAIIVRMVGEPMRVRSKSEREFRVKRRKEKHYTRHFVRRAWRR